MSKQLTTSLLIALIAAVVAAGCGGSDDDGGSDAASATLPSPTVATSSIGKAAFAKQANELCRQATERISGPLVKGLESKPSETATIERSEKAFLGMVERLIGELAELGAPAGEQAQVEAVLGSMRQAYNEASQASTPSMARLTRDFAPAGIVARRNDLTACAFS